MRTWIRYALVVAGVTAIVGAAALHSALSVHRELPSSYELSEMLPPNSAGMHYMHKKSRITQAVIDGRLTLLQAAATFKALEADGPPYPGWIRLERPPGTSEEEYYCRRVIDWVHAAAPPDRVDDLTRSLETELGDRLCDGTLLFPEAIPVPTFNGSE